MVRKCLGVQALPTLTCSVSYFSLDVAKRNVECARPSNMQGSGEELEKFTNLWVASLERLSDSEMRVLAGNAPNIACVAALQLWLPSNLQCLLWAAPFQRALHPVVWRSVLSESIASDLDGGVAPCARSVAGPSTLEVAAKQLLVCVSSGSLSLSYCTCNFAGSATTVPDSRIPQSLFWKAGHWNTRNQT